MSKCLSENVILIHILKGERQVAIATCLFVNSEGSCRLADVYPLVLWYIVDTVDSFINLVLL